MPVKPPDAGAAEDPLGQHTVGIGLPEASCVGALIARREPNLLVSLDLSRPGSSTSRRMGPAERASLSPARDLTSAWAPRRPSSTNEAASGLPLLARSGGTSLGRAGSLIRQFRKIARQCGEDRPHIVVASRMACAA